MLTDWGCSWQPKCHVATPLQFGQSLRYKATLWVQDNFPAMLLLQRRVQLMAQSLQLWL